MSPDLQRRIDEVLLEAARLDPADCERFLDRLPEAERAVAEEVRRRLRAASDLPDDFLSSPATAFLDQAFDADPEHEDGPPVGDERYEIFECLGRGGAASVYRAFDHQLSRPVALKLLHSTGAETPLRLLREARAQARVRHDHVLEVYDTGILGDRHGERHYVALRHVDGGTLADTEGSVPAGMSLEQRVRLVAQAARGLHAAHREGLLHGDVKPSNVLVGRTDEGRPRAWISDFGIATELSRENRGDLAGTPDYMAPELWRQGGAAPDRRSDVYSLGMTLFTVLAGEPPPAGSRDRAALLDGAPSLPPDLAAVVARCIATDPAERYPSARAVADDLQRFLDGEAVEAYADHLSYRLTRFALRHRAILTLAVVSAVLLVAALAVAAALGVQAMRANERAESRRGQAEELIGFMLLDLRDKLESVGRLELLDEVGERAMDYFAAVPENELSDDELAQRSRALYQIGEVQMKRGDLDAAERAFAESLAQARRLSTRHPEDLERLFDLGQSEFWAGLVQFRKDEFGAAEAHLQAYLDVARRLVAEDPDRRDWLQELSYAHSNLGMVLQSRGHLVEALERFRACVDIDRRLLDSAPPGEEDGIRFELAASHNTMGRVLEELGQLDEALHHYRQDVEHREILASREPDHHTWRAALGTSQEFVGVLETARGKLKEARAALDRAAGIFDALAAYDSDNADWRYRQALNRLHLGQWLRRSRETTADVAEASSEGPSSEAAAYFRSAFETASELLATSPERAAWRRLHASSAYELARLHLSSSEAAAARELLDSAVESLDPLTPPIDRVTATQLAEILVLEGDLAVRRGDPDQARRGWSGARATLAPWRMEPASHHEVLRISARIAERLGLRQEAEDVRARLAAIGAWQPVDPSSP